MDTKEKLGRYFTFGELTLTTHRTLAEENRRVPEELLGAARDLCQTLLDPIREHFGRPLIVHSGYRCPALNAAIGGSPTSQHMAFEAADFHVNGADLDDVWRWIWKDSGLRWGQLILEGPASAPPTWIHLSLGPGYRNPARCQQVYTWDPERKYHRVA